MYEGQPFYHVFSSVTYLGIMALKGQPSPCTDENHKCDLP